MTIEIILNADAGASTADASEPSLLQACERHGLRARITRAERGADLTALAKAALARADGPVIAAGGDGTISAVASVLAGSDTPLGVIPVGTLNHFARDLRIPQDVGGAVAVIAAGVTAAVDMGEVNGRAFINNSSLGLYPRFVAVRLACRERGHGRWVATLLASIRVLRHYSFVKVRLTVDGRHFVRRTLVVFVGNNNYALDSLAVGTRASLAAGTLSLFVTHTHHPLRLLLMPIRAVLGRLRVIDLEAMTAREVTLDLRRRSVPVAIDGEIVVLPTPLRYRIRPGALRVLVP